MGEEWLPARAVGTIQREGNQALQVICVGCGHGREMPIQTALERMGPSPPLHRLALRFKCRVCGHLGAHVEPVEPPAAGTPDFEAWRQRRIRHEWRDGTVIPFAKR